VEDAIDKYIKKRTSELIESLTIDKHDDGIDFDSPLEHLFYIAFREHEAMTPISTKNGYFVADIILNTQHEVGHYRIDFLITCYIPEFGDSVMIAVEIDGHEFHEKTKEQASKRNKRDAYLQTHGYYILRFTGSDVYNDVDKCVNDTLVFIRDLSRNIIGKRFV